MTKNDFFKFEISTLNGVEALALRLETKCGFKPENICKISNAFFIHPDELKEELKELIRQSKKGDVVLVLLSGHDIRDDLHIILRNPKSYQVMLYL